MRRGFTTIIMATVLIFISTADSRKGTSFLEIAQKTGVTITEEGKVKIWEGPYTGKTKPNGPLVGKTVGVLVASEFSDFQAYYLASYISEFGGKVEFLLVDWVTWKFTRPNIRTKGVVGMWGLNVDPMPVMDTRHSWKTLVTADPANYDALVVLGGHSADVMMPEKIVINFIKDVHQRGAFVGAIGGGSIPLISAGILNGKRVTGNNVVSFMLKKIGRFDDLPIVRDGQVITAQNTVDSPAFVRELCKAFDQNFVPERKDILSGKRILLIAGEDFEDIELAVPTMEYIYRGASVTLATFPAPLRSRPPSLDKDIVQGNFGISVPFQEISLSDYQIVRLSDVNTRDFDVVQIPGAFCPWNMVAAEEPIKFLKKANRAGKIIAAICHAPIPLAAADLVKGKKIAAWKASKDAVEIMGGTYSWDWSAVIDGSIVTGRVPSDVPEFIDAVTEALLSQ